MEIKSDSNPLWFLAITLASSIYWSAPITDGEMFAQNNITHLLTQQLYMRTIDMV